jgi:hypothetical protein
MEPSRNRAGPVAHFGREELARCLTTTWTNATSGEKNCQQAEAFAPISSSHELISVSMFAAD